MSSVAEATAAATPTPPLRSRAVRDAGRAA